MSKKYIDLSGDISSTYRIDRGVTDYVLHALDRFIVDHPDQMPGRTITMTQLRDGMKAEGIAEGEEYERFWAKTLGSFGITVVPDPEPTNAEKLEKALTDYALQHGGMKGGVDEIAAHLDEAGVKAPGGDDDQ